MPRITTVVFKYGLYGFLKHCEFRHSLFLPVSDILIYQAQSYPDCWVLLVHILAWCELPGDRWLLDCY